MFREITTHKVNGLNDQLRIRVMDEPGVAGACHRYCIELRMNPNAFLMVTFQEEPIGERGVNGVSNEALLAIVRDRLEGFQAGPYACVENEDALGAIKDAMLALARRTQARLDRGVEGTHTL
jgi:hypothetical protein